MPIGPSPGAPTFAKKPAPNDNRKPAAIETKKTTTLKSKKAGGTRNTLSTIASDKAAAQKRTATAKLRKDAGNHLAKLFEGKLSMLPASIIKRNKLTHAHSLQRKIADRVAKQYKAGAMNTDSLPIAIKEQYNLWRTGTAGIGRAQLEEGFDSNSQFSPAVRTSQRKEQAMAHVDTWLKSLTSFYLSDDSPFTAEEKQSDDFKGFIKTITPLSSAELAQPPSDPTRGVLHRYLNSDQFDAKADARFDFVLRMSAYEASFVQAMKSGPDLREKAILVRGIFPPQNPTEYQCTAGTLLRMQQAKDGLSGSLFLNTWNEIKTKIRIQSLPATRAGLEVHLNSAIDLALGVSAKTINEADNFTSEALKSVSANHLWDGFLETLNLGSVVKQQLRMQAAEAVIDRDENPSTSVDDDKAKTYLAPLGINFTNVMKESGLYDECFFWQGAEDAEGTEARSGPEQLADYLFEQMLKQVNNTEKLRISWPNIEEEGIAWGTLKDGDSNQLPSIAALTKDCGRDLLVTQIKAGLAEASSESYSDMNPNSIPQAKAALQALFIYSQDCSDNRPAMVLRALHELGGEGGITAGKQNVKALSNALSKGMSSDDDSLSSIVEGINTRCDYYCNNPLIIGGLKEYVDFLQAQQSANTDTEIAYPIIAMAGGGASTEELCDAIGKAKEEEIKEPHHHFNNNQNTLWIAAKEGRTEVINALLKTGHQEHNFALEQVPHDYPMMLSPLGMAIQGNHLDAFKALIEDKMSYFSPLNSHGETGFMLLANEQHAEMFDALMAQINSLPDIEKLHAQSVTIVRTDINRMGVLHHAIKTGTVHQVRALVDAGSPLIYVDKDGKSLLHYLTEPGFIKESGKQEKFDAVYQKLHRVNDQTLGVMLNYHDINGLTALHNAVIAEDIGPVNALVAAGCRVDEIDMNGQTPFLWAARSGNMACTRKLIDAGSDIKKISGDGRNALHYAASSNNPDLVPLICSKFEEAELLSFKNGLDSRGMSPLHFAAMRGNSGVVNELINVGVKLEYDATYSPFQPIHLAAGSGNIECIKLLKSSQYIDCSQGQTPLQYAIEHDQADAMACLAEVYSLNLNEERFRMPGTNEYIPILHWAIAHSKTNSLERLLKFTNEGKGVDINLQDNHGYTALMAAAKRGNAYAAKRVLETPGADPNIPCREGGRCNILFTALTSGHSQVAIALLSPSLKYNQLINLNDVLPKDSLADLKGPLTYPALPGMSMLHLAAYAKDIALAQALLSTELNQGLPSDHKIDVNKVDADGLSALHYAAQSGDINMLKLLLDKGANVTQTINPTMKRGGRFRKLLVTLSGHKQTALHLAAKNGHPEIVTLLANKMTKAQISTRDGRSDSALIAAIKASPAVERGEIKKCVQALIATGIPISELRRAKALALDSVILTEINGAIERQEQMNNDQKRGARRIFHPHV